MRASRIIIAVCLTLFASAALASWYDDYEAGMKAVSAGNWPVVIQRMTAAINAKPKEGNKERAYGTIFYNYHPHYYRGVAYLNTGKYQQAVSDLETTTGIGPENLGAIDQLIQMAKTKLESSSGPAVVEKPPVVQPPPVTPTGPVIDPALRSRAQNAVNQARAKVTAAQQKNAASPQAAQALQQFTEINTRLINAKSNDDLEAVIAMTDNVTMLAAAVSAPSTTPVPVPPSVTTTKPVAATAVILADPSSRVRKALESYFRGDFDVAARAFQQLAENDLPKNGWIWAFLGAAKYSQYAFEADETYKESAISAFKKAKRLKKWPREGLPNKYFSRRIRKAFDDVG